MLNFATLDIDRHGKWLTCEKGWLEEGCTLTDWKIVEFLHSGKWKMIDMDNG